ncbi:hypothetical protein LWF01_06915 [Saxibacter everestensis]|uniref:DoxX family protein n=1 Tax=Saxibacter everestensis TaxID=2909229 RepID=A0ABY8QZ55_9MICO|nr:hypothetical protein LWF01_06915 [Brevibacteriaceae bacterium ZFBP1038]
MPNAKSFVLSTLLGSAGAMHFVRPGGFEAIVPPGIGSRRFWVYSSGIAELGCAALLVNRRTRRLGGIASAALLIGVFPANLYSVRKFRGEPRIRALAIARLPLQAPLVALAWQVAAESPPMRKRLLPGR